MKQQAYIKIIIVIVALAIALSLFVFKDQLLFGKKPISPFIIDVTNPAYTLTGKVSVNDGYRMTIQNLTRNNLSFTVLITPTTSIYSNTPPTTYFFREDNPHLRFVKPQDIKVGQLVEVTTVQDLRFTQKELIAKTINVLVASNVLHGFITDVSSNVVQIKAKPVLNPVPQSIQNVDLSSTQRESIHSLSINEQTEISHLYPPTTAEELPNPPPPKKYTIDFLQPGMEVQVYTDNNVVDSNIHTALRINPIVTSPTPPVISPPPPVKP